MGREILAATCGRPDDAVSRAADPEQCGMDPAGTEVRAEDFAGGPDWKFIGFPAEIDFPALAAENGIFHLPAVGQPRKQPEAHRLIGVAGLYGQAEPRVGKPAELPKGGYHDGAVTAGGFLGAVFGRHFRHNEAGQGFADFQREQAHGGRFARPGAKSKPGFDTEILIFWN